MTGYEPAVCPGGTNDILACVSVCPTGLSTGEAAPQGLYPVLGPSLQKGQKRARPKKGNNAGEGSGPQVLQGAAAGAGVA